MTMIMTTRMQCIEYPHKFRLWKTFTEMPKVDGLVFRYLRGTLGSILAILTFEYVAPEVLAHLRRFKIGLR